MTRIQGKWIPQETTELKILEKLLRKGPLTMPVIEDKKSNERLSHASVRKGISNLLDEEKIIVVKVDDSIPRRPVKTFEITPVGMYGYLEWVFPEENKPKYSDEIWESIEESRKKFSRKNIITHYFPIINRHWDNLTQIKENPFWWFGTAYGRTELTKTPHGKDTDKNLGIPNSFNFSYTVSLLDHDYDYSLFYELKISQIFLLFSDLHFKELSKHQEMGGIINFSQLQKIISNTITFLTFYNMIYELVQTSLVLRSTHNNQMVSERTKILTSIFTLIKNDRELKELFRTHLAIIDSKIKTNKTTSYLFQKTS